MILLQDLLESLGSTVIRYTRVAIAEASLARAAMRQTTYVRILCQAWSITATKGAKYAQLMLATKLKSLFFFFFYDDKPRFTQDLASQVSRSFRIPKWQRPLRLHDVHLRELFRDVNAVKS